MCTPSTRLGRTTSALWRSSSDEQQARAYAADRSRDHRVVAASVTEFVVGQLGTRHPVAWYRDGQLQEDRARRTGPLYPAEPWSTVETSDVTGS